MDRKLTLEQKIHWAESCNEIEYEYAVHSYYNFKYHGRPGRPSPMKWSDTENIVGTHSFGSMVGYDHAEKNWSSANYTPEERAAMEDEKKKSYIAKYPQAADIYDRGTIGFVGLHSVCTSIIEVARDGRSARASFYTPGIMGNNARPDGKQWCCIMWERYGTDWILEDGEWKTIHNQVAEDFTEDMDHINYAEFTWKALMETGICACRLMGDFRPRGIDIRGPAHMSYSPVQVPQYNCIWPEPYDTLAHSNWYVAKPGDGTQYSVVFEKEGFDKDDALTFWFGPPLGGKVVKEEEED